MSRTFDIPASLEEKWIAAQQLFANGAYEEALEETRLLLAEKDDFYSFWCLEGHIRIALEEFKAAERAFNRACDEAPETAEPLLHKARFLNVLERFDEAESCLEEAALYTETPDDQRDAFFLQAQTKFGIAQHLWVEMFGEFIEESDMMGEAPMSMPNTPEEITELLEEALELTEKAIELEVEHETPAIWHLRAHCLLRMERLEESVECFQKAVELSPEESELWHDLGLAYEEMDDEDGARAAYQELHRLTLESTNGLELSFEPDEFAEHFKNAWQDQESDAIENLEVNTPNVDFEFREFPDAAQLEDPSQTPFDPWAFWHPILDDQSDAHKIMLYQRNIERELSTEDPEELYMAARQLSQEILLFVLNVEYGEEPIEA